MATYTGGPFYLTDGRCWRCILLDEPCDDNDFRCCDLCGNDQAQYPNIECTKGDIIDANWSSGNFEGVREIEDGIWHFKGTWRYLEFHIDYGEVPEEEVKTSIVLDLPLCTKIHSCPDLRQSIIIFLDQFLTLEQRWTNEYEDITVEIIDLCATYQKDLLLKTPDDEPTDTHKDYMLITSALRCLVTAHEIADIGGHWPVSGDLPGVKGDPGIEEDSYHACVTETSKSTPYMGKGNRGGYTPKIEVWKLPFNDTMPQSTREPFEHMLLDAVRLAHKTILRKDPKDWPYVFCSLCIFRLIEVDLENTKTYTDALLDATLDFRQTLITLCGAFLLCVKDCHPLHSNFDSEKYALLVNGNEMVIRVYAQMSGIWIQNTRIEYDGEPETAETFHEKLDELVMGFIM